VQKLSAGAAAIRPLAFQGVGSGGTDAPLRVDGTRASMQPEARSMAQP
jgi:hypothetical protein